jgi:hypothetical protein
MMYLNTWIMLHVEHIYYLLIIMTQYNPLTIQVDGPSLYANSQLLGLYTISGGDNVTISGESIQVNQDPSFTSVTVNGDITVSGDVFSQGRNILSEIDTKQDTLTYGTGIDISNNVISASATAYTEGDNVTISGETIHVNQDPSFTSVIVSGDINVSGDVFVKGVNISSGSSSITKYMFHVTNETNGDVTFGQSPTIIPFNSIDPSGCFEIGSGYDYSTYKYTIPKSGMWRISIRVFINTSSTTANARISLLNNNNIIATVGNKIGNAESLEILYNFTENDILEATAERMIVLLESGRSYWTGEWVCDSDGTLSGDTSSITKPMFHVTNETNNNVTFGQSPTIIPFNSISPTGCFEIGSGFNYSTYKYTIPKSGVWRISIRAFINTSSTTDWARLSLLKNNNIIATVGNKIGNTESLEILYDFIENDVIETTAERMILWLASGHSYWTGEWVCNSDGTL